MMLLVSPLEYLSNINLKLIQNLAHIADISTNTSDKEESPTPLSSEERNYTLNLNNISSTSILSVVRTNIENNLGNLDLKYVARDNKDEILIKNTQENEDLEKRIVVLPETIQDIIDNIDAEDFQVKNIANYSHKNRFNYLFFVG